MKNIILICSLTIRMKALFDFIKQECLSVLVNVRVRDQLTGFAQQSVCLIGHTVQRGKRCSQLGGRLSTLCSSLHHVGFFG